MERSMGCRATETHQGFYTERRITMPHCYQVPYILYRHHRYPTSYTPNPMPHQGFYTERRLTMPHCYQVLLPGLGV